MKFISFTFLLPVLVCVIFAGEANAQITGIRKTCTPSPPGVTPAVIPSTSLSDSHPGGTWASDNPPVATVTSSGIVFGVHSGDAIITYTYSGGWDTATVHVYGQPPGFSVGVGYACAGYTLVLHDDSVGTWMVSNTSIATIASSGPNTATLYGIANGFENIYFTQTNTGCTFRNVDVAPVPVYGPGPISGPSSVCVGSTINLSDSIAGGTWSSSNTGIATVDVTAGIVRGETVGIATISYSKVILPCPSITFTTKIVTVNTVPVVRTITGLSVVCAGATINLSDSTTGGVWSSGSAGIATVGSGGIVTGVSGGSATISYSVTNGCGTTTVVKTITVNTPPTVGFIGGPSAVCAAASIPLSDPTTGGVWNSSNVLVATVGGTGIVTGVAAGSAAIFYTVTNACGTATATQLITVNALAAGTITGPSGACAGSTVTLTDIAPGGVWSSSNASVATVSAAGFVTTGTTGVVIISYTATNLCGTSTATKTITVDIFPDAGSITGASSLCQGATIPLTDLSPGGTWSSSSTGIATVGGTGIVSGVAGGSATILYTVTNACGTATAAQSIAVNPLPATGTITGPAGVCAGGAITLTDPAPGGVWNSSSPVATVAGGVVMGISAGVTIISYSVTNTCGTIAATKTIAVNVFPVAGTIAGISSLCAGSSTTFTDSSPGGVWTSGSTAVASVGSLGTVSGVAGGTAVIYYNVTNACGTATATKSITINPIPTGGTITGPSGVCVGATIILTDPVTGGVWSSSSPSATVSGGFVTGMAPGSANIFYSVTNPCGAIIVSHPVTVDVAPGVGPITGPSGLCAGAAITLADATPGGVWISGSTGIATTSGTGVITGVAAGTVTISYMVGNACATALATKSVTVNSTPAPDTIAGPSSICAGLTVTFTDATPGGVWSSSSTGTATVGSTGTVSTAAGTATISYTVANACGTATATKSVTIDLSPVVGNIKGPSNVCSDSMITLTDSVTGGEWSSGNTAAATVGSTGIVYGLAAGNATIFYSLTNVCGTATTHMTVAVENCPVRENMLNAKVAELKVFPNPSAGAFTVNMVTEADEQAELAITDIVGTKIKDITIATNRDNDIRLEKAAGMYLLSVKTAAGIFVSKVVIQ